MHSTKWWALGLVIICTFFTATAALLIKAGVMKVNSIFSFFNMPLLAGLTLEVVAAVLLIIALKFGELSVLYPAIATSFIWVNMLSIFFLGEGIPIIRWVGIGFIVLGVSLIGFGSNTGKEIFSRCF